MTTDHPRSPAATDRSDRWSADALRGAIGRWWHVIFLGSLLFQPMLEPGSTTSDWVIAVVLVVVGLGLVVVGYGSTGRRHTMVTAAFALLGVTMVWVNASASVFFIYAAGSAGTFASRARAYRWFIALTLALIVMLFVSPVPMPFRLMAFAFPIVLVWMIGFSVAEDAEQARESRRLRIDNARIERLATLGERERIARDLHDLLGHTLTGIVVRAQLIQRVAASDPGRAASEAADVETIARDALSEVRSAVTGWRHHALDAEIDVACDVLTAAGVELRTETSADVSMSPAVEAAVALAVREGVTNVVRHAGASSCRIEVTTVDDHVRLIVADDGRGSTAPDGSGLTGMRERLTALGGRVERRMDDGTTLTVMVPAQGVT
jgi:two-component system sensor histidine kinase DesK